MTGSDFETSLTGGGVGRDLPPSGLPRADALPLEEELERARRIEAGLFATKLLSGVFGEHPLSQQASIDPELKQDLETIIGEGKDAFDQLVLANTGLAVSIAQRFRTEGVEETELINAAVVGLLHGIEKYDYIQGFTVRTYAAHWIQKEVRLVAAGSKTGPYIPKDRREDATRLRRTTSDLAVQLGRQPSSHELAAATNIELAEVEWLQAATAGVASLELPVGKGGEVLGDLLIDETPDSPESLAVYADGARRVRQIVSTLTDLTPARVSTSEVVRKYFGIGGKPHTMVEIAKTLKVGKNYIAKVLKHAREQLKTRLPHDLFD
jgi:RNA polymerase sigma factor (sigma-70 family)